MRLRIAIQTARKACRQRGAHKEARSQPRPSHCVAGLKRWATRGEGNEENRRLGPDSEGWHASTGTGGHWRMIKGERGSQEG